MLSKQMSISTTKRKKFCFSFQLLTFSFKYQLSVSNL